MHSRNVIMGTFLAKRDAPLCCTATDCLVLPRTSDLLTKIGNCHESARHKFSVTDLLTKLSVVAFSGENLW